MWRLKHKTDTVTFTHLSGVSITVTKRSLNNKIISDLFKHFGVTVRRGKTNVTLKVTHKKEITFYVSFNLGKTQNLYILGIKHTLQVHISYHALERAYQRDIYKNGHSEFILKSELAFRLIDKNEIENVINSLNVTYVFINNKLNTVYYAKKRRN